VAPPHDGSSAHVLYYNIVLFLTTAEPVASDGPPSAWRVLAFPGQNIAFTIQHATVLVCPSERKVSHPDNLSFPRFFPPKKCASKNVARSNNRSPPCQQVWLPHFSPHFQSFPLGKLSFNQVTLSAQLQHHASVIDGDGPLARAETELAALRAALVAPALPSVLLGPEATARVRRMVD